MKTAIEYRISAGTVQGIRTLSQQLRPSYSILTEPADDWKYRILPLFHPQT